MQYNLVLEPGSIWFDLSPGEIVVFSPFRKKEKIYKVKGSVLVKKIDREFSDNDAFYYWVSSTINQEFKSACQLPEGTNQKLYSYHKGLRRVDSHFESSEKTLSYMFRKPHPAFGGVSYGERLFNRVFSKGFIPSGRISILDVGAGAGIHTRDFLSQMENKLLKGDFSAKYVSLDLAPGLLKSQRQYNVTSKRKHFFVQADAIRLPFSREMFDLIIVNEVIADFPVTKVIKAQSGRCGHIKRYGLNVNDAPPKFLINSGAMDFLEGIRRVLKPGGKAVIIEYGDECAYPVATVLGGHLEYSIHFGHLITAAKKIGFRVEYEDMFNFFKFKPSVWVITGNSLVLLQRLMKYLSRALPAFAYTEEMLRLELGGVYDKIHNLQFQKLKELAGIFSIQEFKALLLSK